MNFNKMTDTFGEAMRGKFGRIEDGCARLSMNGEIAIKTSGGYKTYNPKTRRLTNCSNFVFDLGSEMFFVIPTNKVVAGDIILANGKPRYVISATKDELKTINYETGVVEAILPERHVFMGNTYFYGKIVSMFGNIFSDKKKGANKMMQMMMMQSMFGGAGNGDNGGVGNMMAMMMLTNGGNMFGDMFDGMFDTEDEDDEDGGVDATGEEE